MSTIQLDLRGLSYMMPLVKLASAMKKANTGDVIEVVSNYPNIDRDVKNWCASTGNALEKIVASEGYLTLLVVKKQ